MDRTQAEDLVGLIRGNPNVGVFQVAEERRLPLRKFHSWANDKDGLHGLKIASDDAAYWLVFLQWNRDKHPERYHMVAS